jgi:hypothetical protein
MVSSYLFSSLERCPTPDWYLPVVAPWKEIEAYVAGLQKNYGISFWEEIKDKPITTEFIDGIIKNGWKVFYKEGFVYAGVVTKDNKILLRDTLTPIKRDITLFHELAHIRHPVLLSSQGIESHRIKCEREIITEWLGRKARADPELLRYAVHSFELQPHIYDLASYKAFKGLDKQLDFYFVENTYSLLMD